MTEQPVNYTNTQKQDGTIEVDIKRLFRAVFSKLPLIILVAVLCGALAFVGTKFFITPLYQSSALFYVNNSDLSFGDAEVSISTGDISASKSLVDSYIVILKSRESLIDVIDYAGVDRTYGELKEMISAASVNGTEIFQVVVTSEDPKEATVIANAIAEILPKRIATIVEGSSAKVVDHAVVPSVPASPSYTTNTMLGALIGLLLTTIIVAMVDFFDVTIKSLEDVRQCCAYPVLATVPNMGTDTKTKGKRYQGRHAAATAKGAVAVGDEVNFVASEAYKLLRTKLQFSFADENHSHVIAVSSAMEGEGKSLTAVNMAYSLAQLDKKILLVECDMRRPSLTDKIRIQRTPGLANYLTGQESLDAVVQTCKAGKSGAAFDVVAAGSLPPNPIELLSSQRMLNFVNRLREAYDYILLDLPPVGEVSDSMVAAKLADGVLLVSRQNYCNRLALADAIRQFEFVGIRILGVLVNAATEDSGGKYYKSRYRKYGYGRYGRYSRYGYYGRYGESAEKRDTPKT